MDLANALSGSAFEIRHIESARESVNKLESDEVMRYVYVGRR